MKNFLIVSSFITITGFFANTEVSFAQDCGGHRRTTCGSDGCFESESRWAPQLGSCEWNRVREVRNPDDERRDRERREHEREREEWERERREHERERDEWEREHNSGSDYDFDYDYSTSPSEPAPSPISTPTARPTPLPPPAPIARTIEIKQETYFKSVTASASIVVSFEKCKLSAGASVYGYILGTQSNHLAVKLASPISGCSFGKQGQQGFLFLDHIRQ